MGTCQSDNLKQVFSYELSTRAIKIGGKCLDYNYSNQNVYISECHYKRNQQWYYNSVTKEIKSVYNEKCLDKSSNDNLYMYECHGRNNQKFDIPSGWDMTPIPVRDYQLYFLLLLLHI